MPHGPTIWEAARPGQGAILRRTMVEHARSGLSIAAFCRREGLKPWTFRWGRQELARRDRKATTDGADPAPGPSTDLVLCSAFLPVLGVGVPEPLAEVVLPALGEPGGLRRATEKLLILSADGVEPDHARDGHPLIHPLDRLDGVARPDLALGRHREVEAGPAVPEHPLEHVHPAEPDPELVAGQPRLRDDELG